MRTINELGISPAPWRVDDRTYGDQNQIICDYSGDIFVVGEMRTRVIATTNHYFTESKADARLIAAAPKLYEALAAMVHCAELNKPYLDMSHMDIAMDMARKALAAASGESDVGGAK